MSRSQPRRITNCAVLRGWTTKTVDNNLVSFIFCIFTSKTHFFPRRWGGVGTAALRRPVWPLVSSARRAGFFPPILLVSAQAFELLSFPSVSASYYWVLRNGMAPSGPAKENYVQPQEMCECGLQLPCPRKEEIL